MLEFCYRNVAEPIQQSFHSFFRHYHLRFDRESGKREFRAKINRILLRNVIAYELDESGCIQPLAPPVIREELASAMFRTEDRDLDELLEAARTKFLSSDLKVRREALEKLWDAWERLKTLEHGDKKASAAKLLEKAASEPTFRARLKREAAELTSIGNSFQIRHSETSQVPLACEHQVDYLFHRLFSMILLLLRSRSA